MESIMHRIHFKKLHNYLNDKMIKTNIGISIELLSFQNM